MSIFDGLIANALGGNGGGGGGSAPLMVHIIENGSLWTLDKTWNEIAAAVENGVAIIKSPEGYDPFIMVCVGVELNSGTYIVHIPSSSSYGNFSSATADGYPEISFD